MSTCHQEAKSRPRGILALAGLAILISNLSSHFPNQEQEHGHGRHIGPGEPITNAKGIKQNNQEANGVET